MRGVLFALVVALCGASSSAQADADRPTSGDISILGGRTLGNDQTVLAAGAGYPRTWVAAFFAPSSRLNVGLRASVLYGSPIMSSASAPGGQLALLGRYHVLGSGDVDLALVLEPAFSLGQGALFGQRGVFADNFGWSAHGDFGLRAGWEPWQGVTMVAGALGRIAWLDVQAANERTLVGGVYAALGVEGLLSRSFMLFAEADVGGGFAPGNLFSSHVMFDVTLGVAYLP